MDGETSEALDVLTGMAASDRSERHIEIRQIVGEIFDSKTNLGSKSVLNREQIVAAAAAYTVAEYLESDTLKQFTDYLLELKISQGGLGRRNLENVLAAISNREDKNDDKGFLRRIFGF